MSPIERRLAVETLFAGYAYLIDQGKFDAWLDLFAEESSYKILPRENVDQGLPLSLFVAENKNMLRDRIMSLRNANIFNIHYDRHLISAIRIVDDRGDTLSVEANYAVFHTDQEGGTRIFSVGTYVDTIVFVDGQPRFKDKLVIADTAAVQTLLSTPI